MRSWTPAVPLVAALGFSAAVFEKLPHDARPSLRPLLPALPAIDSEPLPRLAIALLVPVTAALVWALFAWLSRIQRPGRPFPSWLANESTDARAVARFASTYHTIVFAIIACLALSHIVVLGSVIGWPVWTFRILTASYGLLILTVGNVMPRARPNWIVGIRTKTTLASAEVWMRTHRLLGALLMTTGALVLAATAVAPRYALLVALAGGLASLVTAHALGTRGRHGATPLVVALALAAATSAFTPGLVHF